jgi:hypothetical protein
LRHLVKRFFGHLFASSLTPTEQERIATNLRPQLLALFYRQSIQDQRHALEVAARLGSADHLTEAALLHDVGKTASGLGVIQRSIVTLWTATGLPLWGTWQQYVDHGPIGAALLTSAGADQTSVLFARSHPGPVPEGVSRSDWHILETADNV